MPFPNNFSLSFDGDLPGMPRFLWTVSIQAICHNCGKKALLAPIDDGTMVSCQSCNTHSINRELPFQEAVEAVLQRAAATNEQGPGA